MSDELAKEVRFRVEEIRTSTGDAELAHIKEKALWRDVLRMAEYGYDVKDAAKEALKTTGIDFPRWFA